MYATEDDIKKLGTILGIWAHPDDESWCMSGIMAVAAANGQRVACITATRGDAGQTADEKRWPQAKLGEIREKELERALDVLGVQEHYWLDYKDGQLLNIDSEPATNKITDIIKQVKPDTVFTFGEDGLTGHDDHRTIHHWTRSAIKKSGLNPVLYCMCEVTEKYEAINPKCHELFNIYFNIDKPVTVAKDKIDFFFELPPNIIQKRLESLRVQECQMTGFFSNPLGVELMNQLAASEGFMRVKP